jgi:lipopolysaccharide transport system permease protein
MNETVSLFSVSTRDEAEEVGDSELLPVWDSIIEPRGSLFELHLDDLWRYRDLLWLFTRRDIVSFYKQTILGPLWFFIQPIFTTLIYVLVFGQIAKLSTDGAPQFLFYLCGIAFWNYFSECLNKTATVFKDNANLFGKVYFPRLIVPLSIVLSNLSRFFIQFALFLAIWLYYVGTGAVKPNWAIAFFPILVATMAAIGLGAGLLFSAVTTKYRDMVFLLQFGVQLLMYATPVIYPTSQIPAKIANVLKWNPLAPIFETARYGLLGTGQFSWLGLSYSVLFAAVLLISSAAIFNKVERTFMDTV